MNRKGSTPSTPTSQSSVNSISQQKFGSNLCAVLNDPRKDRTKIAYLFTKTWGYEFVDTAPIPPIGSIYAAGNANKYRNIKHFEFKEHLDQFGNRHTRHFKHKVEQESSDGSAVSKQKQQQHLASLNEQLELIPKIFFDSNFSLTNKEIFNSIITQQIFQPSSSSNGYQNGLLVSKQRIQEAESCRLALDKLGQYLDITEANISRQISTKANTFFNAMHSQDEVQEHIQQTCSAVKNLRQNISYIDERVVLTSIRIIKQVYLKMRYKSLIEKLELMSTVYQTQPTIQLQLASSEFTGALDLISMSQDILRQDLRGIRALRHYDSQFNEIEKAVDKILHQEFTKYVISDLSRDFSLGTTVSNEEKLSSLILGILRLKTSNFVDLCKDEIFIYLKSIVKQTVVEYVSQIDDDSLVAGSVVDEDGGVKLIDRVRQLKIQEFLHLIAKILANVRTMLARVKEMIYFMIGVLNFAAGIKVKDVENDNLEFESTSDVISSSNLTKRELLTKEKHQKLVISLKDLLHNSCDYAQERLVNLLEGKFKENGLEKLNSNDFISLSNLIDQFIIDFDTIANKKTSSLRSWLQNQANKFLIKFHNEKKEKLGLAMDSERWKQIEIPAEIQTLIDNLLANGISATTTTNRKFDSRGVKSNCEYLIINNQKYVVFGTVVVLLKLMIEYCQFSVDIPNLSYDVMTRLIEIFSSFNARSYKMILGVGAIEQNILRIITFKTLAITYRSLEFVLYFLPMSRDFFKEKLGAERQSNVEKQFGKLISDYKEHLTQLNNKLVFMIDEKLRECLCQYEVIAPVPSQSFRTICQQITRVHEIVCELLAEQTIVELFTEIHEKFKTRLKERLKELNVVNDGGPQHALIFSDMTYYIKQFKNLKGLHLISINFIDVWAT